MGKERFLVLVVDDDDELRGLLELCLNEINCSMYGAENTYLAKKWLSAHRPDLILVDIMMPDGNGLDFCRWVRSQAELKSIPILVNSGLKDEATAQDSLELGAVDFIRKPYSMEIIKEKIARFRPKNPNP